MKSCLIIVYTALAIESAWKSGDIPGGVTFVIVGRIKHTCGDKNSVSWWIGLHELVGGERGGPLSPTWFLRKLSIECLEMLNSSNLIRVSKNKK